MEALTGLDRGLEFAPGIYEDYRAILATFDDVEIRVVHTGCDECGHDFDDLEVDGGDCCTTCGELVEKLDVYVIKARPPVKSQYNIDREAMIERRSVYGAAREKVIQAANAWYSNGDEKTLYAALQELRALPLEPCPICTKSEE